MLRFDSFVRGMIVPYSPFLTHISNTELLSTMVDCACTFFPPTSTTTLHVLPHVSYKVKTKSAFGCCSSQRVVNLPPIEELQISVDSSDCLNDDGNGVVGLSDSLESSLSKKVLKERMRRIKIGLANKGRVPWNKGRKHTAETRERIRLRTLEALRDPKVKSS